MRRRECGIVRDGVGRQLPAPYPEPVGPSEPALSQAPNPKEKARRMVRWPCYGLTRPGSASGPSRGFPGRQNRRPQRTFPQGTVVAVGKNCDPTGVATEQASNTARGTPKLRRSRVQFPRLASKSRGFEARGSGSLNADNEARRSARPLLFRDRRNRTTTPPRR
jgi:hypothetical protein